MEIVFVIMLFCMGAVFGSFFTLAVYRIPLNLDITHERSFCPNCNHRLEFLDLIPILSYLSLGGKCRYCGKPVRIRYLLLEVTSGLIFVVAYFAFGLKFPFFEKDSVLLMIAFVMFYVTNAIILGIDKEYIKIDKRVLLFGIIMQSIYMLYLYTFQNVNIYRYGIYILILLLLFSFDIWSYKKNAKDFYFVKILMLMFYEISFIDNLIKIVTMIIMSFVICIVYKSIKKSKIPVGFCISISSIATVLIGNFII